MSGPTRQDIIDLITFAVSEFDGTIGLRLADDDKMKGSQSIAAELGTIATSLGAVAEAIDNLAEAVRGKP